MKVIVRLILSTILIHSVGLSQQSSESIMNERDRYDAEDLEYILTNMVHFVPHEYPNNRAVLNQYEDLLIKYESPYLLGRAFDSALESDGEGSEYLASLYSRILLKAPKLFISQYNSLTEKEKPAVLGLFSHGLSYIEEPIQTLNKIFHEENIPEQDAATFISELVYKIIQADDIDAILSLFKEKQIYSPFELPTYRTISYKTENLADNKLTSCWAYDQAKAEDPYIILKVEEEPSSISIWNGYQKNDVSFNTNNRVKSIRVIPICRYGINSCSESQSILLSLKDEPGEQKFSLNGSMSGGKARQKHDRIEYLLLRILDVYAGSKFDDTCLSEILLR